MTTTKRTTAGITTIDEALEFTESELDTLLSPASVTQMVDRMLKNGTAPSLYLAEASSSIEVVSDVVDAIRWQDQYVEKIKDMRLQDTETKHPWLDDLVENLIVYDLYPSMTSQETSVILRELDEELETMENSGYGPEARNFIVKMRRELQLLIEK